MTSMITQDTNLRRLQMYDDMEEVTYRQQLQFSIQTLAFAIDNMIDTGKTHLFYSNIAEGDRLYGPAVLRKHILEVVIALQEIYRGQCVVSRTPGGIVVDKI